MVPLSTYYTTLFDSFGPQFWWPGETTLEIIVGAVLTQNTNWQNVEKALTNLKTADLLHFQSLLDLPLDLLAQYIRPSGYYNLKAARLKNLLVFIHSHLDSGQDLESFFTADTALLREQLLSIKGIGPETADSILLYAGKKPVFVIDAYTHRLLSRHGFVGEESSYDEMQELMMSELPSEEPLFNEFHALIVILGKKFCKKKKPNCNDCPLAPFLPGR
jgi:endonuclease-3 related protein